VAAKCETGAIFGASDRMITSGDIEFEPPMQKIWQLTGSIAMMVAGDVGLRSMFWSDLWEIVQRRLKSDPSRLWRVRDVAALYQKLWATAHSRMAERILLQPLGLSLPTFIERQPQMTPEFSRRLAEKLQTYPPHHLDVSVIVAGVDDVGSHIYIVEDGEITCRDIVGFAAIGAGAGHAKSHFMISQHTPYETIPRTLFRSYVAKRRAEVAPGVGDSTTDMFVVGPNFDSFNRIPRELMQPLEEIYQGHIEATKIVASTTDGQVAQYLAQLQAKSSPEQPPSTGTPQPTKQEPDSTAKREEQTKPKKPRGKSSANS